MTNSPSDQATAPRGRPPVVDLATWQAARDELLIREKAHTHEEGDWSGDLIVIEFPDLERARAWYESPAYQEILPLRAEHSRGAILLIDGEDADHAATDVLGR